MFIINTFVIFDSFIRNSIIKIIEHFIIAKIKLDFIMVFNSIAFEDFIEYIKDFKAFTMDIKSFIIRTKLIMVEF